MSPRFPTLGDPAIGLLDLRSGKACQLKKLVGHTFPLCSLLSADVFHVRLPTGFRVYSATGRCLSTGPLGRAGRTPFVIPHPTPGCNEGY